MVRSRPTAANDVPIWCEVIKDIVALANSGGGIIVFGLNSRGDPVGSSVAAISNIDPADVTNRVLKYTSVTDFELEIRDVEKNGVPLCAFIVPEATLPIIFNRLGTYDIGGGKPMAS